MTKKNVTLYIDDSCLRLMVTKGTRITDWAEVSLEPDLVENLVVTQEQEFAATVRQLLKDHGIRKGKIMVGISGLRSRSRSITIPQMPESMMEDAITQEAETALLVPLDQMYLSRLVVGTVDEKTLVYLAAVPRDIIDSLFKALRAAGFRPTFMNLKPLLLAGMVREKMAVIVDIQTTEFDIVLMTDGIPQPVRTILLSQEVDQRDEILSTIIDEVSRTITFHNSENPENPFSPDVPLFVSGEMAGEPEVCESISLGTGHQVSPLSLPMQFPDELPTGRFTANIGMVHQQLSAGAPDEQDRFNQNILPAQYLPARISLLQVGGVLGIVAAAGLLAWLMVANQSASAVFNETSRQFEVIAQNLLDMESQQLATRTEINEFEAKLSELTASDDSISAMLNGLEKQRLAISSDLTATILSLPTGINLRDIGHITSILTITGEAPGENTLLTYIRKLDESGRFGTITVTEMTRNEGGTMDFTLVGTLQEQSIGASSMEIALGSVPATVALTSVNATDTTISISGTSPAEEKIFSYLRALEASEKFSLITVRSIINNAEDGLDFNLMLQGIE